MLRIPCVVIGTILSLSPPVGLVAQSAQDPLTPEKAFTGLSPRELGPALTSGRVTDFAVHPDRTQEYFVATASGGLWKTTNNGTNWTPVFDGEESYSIGVVELDPNNPNIVWVGSGENNSQRSVAYGDGVYKSVDGGKSWSRVGLENSQHIGQILIDPADSQTVLVAAQGPLWNSGGDRGLYKTVDGGAQWSRVLHVDEDTGVNEVVAAGPGFDVLVASSYQRRRHLWTLINGGPGSGIHRSTDRGETWSKVTSGLPAGDLGRIGLAAAPSAPHIVYAIVEAAAETRGVYRSTDGGASWEKRSGYMTSSPQYYNELVVDPVNSDKVYAMDTFMHVSLDGARTWARVGIKHKHVDEHALWIDPAQTEHLLAGGDGGVYESWDGGSNWRHMRNLPLTQFYRVKPDNALPFYNVYGGTQDNYSIGGPSRTMNTGGIANEDWILTLGGDGFKSQPDPQNPDIIYAQLQYGVLVRYDRTTGEKVLITPQPGPGEDNTRFNWNSPLIVSPHDNRRLYFAGERVFRSDDQGNSWTAVSDDLSQQVDRNQLEVMGRVWSVDAISKNRSTSIWGSVVSLSESPLEEGLLYAGTDDGLIQVREGADWRRIDTIAGIPEFSYVADLEASVHAPDRVYATFDNHKKGDFKPYVLRSTDRGRRWESIAADLPERGTVHTIVEDHIDPDLLLVGTEFGIYATQDGGGHWFRIKGGFPTIAVRDLEIQRRESDLVIATFGRGFWILDDYSPLRTQAKALESQEGVLFPVREALLYVPNNRWISGPKGFQGEEYFVRPNPPFGAVFSYHLRESLLTRREERRRREREVQKEGGDTPYPSWEALQEEDREEAPMVVLTVRDAEGAIVRRVTGPTKKGLHRVAWDLRHPSPDPVSLKPPSPGLFSSPPVGPYVAPGEFSVTLSKREEGVWTDMSDPVAFQVSQLDRGLFTAPDPEALQALHLGYARLRGAVQGAVRAAAELQSRLDHLRRAFRDSPAVSEEQQQRLRTAQTRLTDARVLLEGDSTRATRSEQSRASILGRVNRVIAMQWQTLAEVPPNLRQSLEIAQREFGQVSSAFHIVEAELSALVSELGETLPWTPGTLPGTPRNR